MSRDVKSLAAEIEAVLRRFVHAGPDGHAMGLPEASKVLAANQSRAFEDGERSMRQRAEDVARTWMMPKLSAAEQDFVSKQHIAERRVRNETVSGIADRIAALQPESANRRHVREDEARSWGPQQREMSRLRWLRDNPGSWGLHLDLGEPCGDAEMRKWVANGWIESRPHVTRVGRHITSYGYFLTDAGLVALAEQEKGDA